MTIKSLLPAQYDPAGILNWWSEKRKDIQQRFQENLGSPPFPRNTRSIETIETYKNDNYVRYKMRYVVGDQEKIHAYLYIPNTAKKDPGFPAILAMHQMNDYGKDEVAGIHGSKDYGYGYELAKRGYVVIAPDYLSMGERIFLGKQKFDTLPFYKKYPNWSMVGKDIQDSMSAIDVLYTMNVVDQEKIGVIGHSHGGSNAIFAMAMDERISAGVSNCGFSVISEEGKCLEWSSEDEYIYFPTLRHYLLEKKELPFDLNEVAALIAPRPWCNISAYYDKTLGNQEFLAGVGTQINQVYKLYDKQNHFCFLMHGNDHSFPKYARSLAYDWLDKFLLG
jgi:dienelactone hydrolase